MSVVPTHQGEVQFVTFADSSKGGPRITLRLHDRDELEAFVGKEGKRYMCVLVEIGDDEQPVAYPKDVHYLECDDNNKPLLGPAAYWLVQRCKEPMFQAWLKKEGGFSEDLTEAKAAEIVKSWCGVGSRKEIDGNTQSLANFQNLIRGPYMKTWTSRAYDEEHA